MLTLSNSELLTVTAGITATIERVHFRDGRATTNGAAIDNRGNLTLESCIFSGNQTSAANALGGAIYNNSATLTVKGCTFYNNIVGNTTGTGGAIYSTGANSNVYLAGNLFYENNNGNSNSNYPVVHQAGGTVTSHGFNVADHPSGTAAGQSGWIFETSDMQRTTSPFYDVNTFTPEADILPANIPDPWWEMYMPKFDFYGEERTLDRAPGAVKQP